MSRNKVGPCNSAILHLRIRVQPSRHCLGDNAALVLLQSVDLRLDVGSEGVNLGTLGVKESNNAELFVKRWINDVLFLQF